MCAYTINGTHRSSRKQVLIAGILKVVPSPLDYAAFADEAFAPSLLPMHTAFFLPNPMFLFHPLRALIPSTNEARNLSAGVTDLLYCLASVILRNLTLVPLTLRRNWIWNAVHPKKKLLVYAIVTNDTVRATTLNGHTSDSVIRGSVLPGRCLYVQCQFTPLSCASLPAQ